MAAAGRGRPQGGHTFSQPDLIIAATALCHGLTILSRDASDYERARVGPLGSSSRLQRRGDLRPVQPDFDPVGRDGYQLDNVQDEAFHLDGRRGEPSLGKRESIAQCESASNFDLTQTEP
jgi:hypothetical protein